MLRDGRMYSIGGLILFICCGAKKEGRDVVINTETVWLR